MDGLNIRKVTVIVPIYNTEQFLPACIESILCQTYSNIELFLVDDGSTDDSLSICQKYAQNDSRIIVLRKENGGQGSARNMALERMSGEYVSFVDSDDYISPTMLQEMVENIELYGADLAVCYIKVITKDGKSTEKSLLQSTYYNNKELMRAYASTQDIGEGPCNKLYRSKLFSKLRFPEIRTSEDTYIMHEILGMCEGAVHLGKAYYVQNIRDNSTEHKPFSELNLVLLECAERTIEYYEKNYPEFVELVAFRKVNKTANLMRRILIGGNYCKYRKIYKELEEGLIKEYQMLIALYPEHPGVTSRTREIVQHPVWYKIINILRGIKKQLFRR